MTSYITQEKKLGIVYRLDCSLCCLGVRPEEKGGRIGSYAAHIREVNVITSTAVSKASLNLIFHLEFDLWCETSVCASSKLKFDHFLIV